MRTSERGDMDVLVALGAHPVPDRHPGRRLRSFSLEPQRFHDHLAYLCPLLVAERAIPGGKRQRKVVEMPAHRIRAVGVVGLIEGRSEISDLLG